ncbi:MAG TPA: hypothetical protein VK184_17285 [Nostocaceae cyanobacterium]|nr:hypothetical protein [Nostocaceae cyanobacterium]
MLNPPPVFVSLLKLNGITKTQRQQYINRAAKAGGVDAQVSKTFSNRSKEENDVFVDIEVIKGKAFVPDSTTK